MFVFEFSLCEVQNHSKLLKNHLTWARQANKSGVNSPHDVNKSYIVVVMRF